MGSHSIELLHPTEPPGRRALRLVVLVVLLGIIAGALAWATDPLSHVPAAAPGGPNTRNP